MNQTPEFAPYPHTEAHLNCLNCFAKLPATTQAGKKKNSYTLFFVCFLLCIISWKTFPTSTAFGSNHISDLFLLLYFSDSE